MSLLDKSTIQMIEELSAKVEELSAKAEIHDLLVRYCRGCDRADEDEVNSVFHADAYVDYGWHKGSPAVFAAFAAKADFVSSSHLVTNSLIVVDGDSARGETHVLAWLRSCQAGGRLQDLHVACRYIDRFEKRSGIWKIAHRVTVMDRDRVDTDVVPNPESLTASLVKGLRTRQDLSYGVVGK